MSYWELTKMGGKNPVHTGSFLNGYEQGDFSSEEVLVRESIQNSIDAGKEIKKLTTEIEFHEIEFKGEGKRRLLETIQFQKMINPRFSSFNYNNSAKNFAEQASEFINGKSIHALLIRDKNTTGLSGAWDEYEKGDHFARLVCALNLDDKADDDANSGGSYGLGKTTYAVNSYINTVLYHSVFEPDTRSNGVGRRLMVSGIYPRHDFEGSKYSGYAFFGEKERQDSDSARPFQDEEAERFWEDICESMGEGKLESLQRKESDYGTDVLILMTKLDFEKIQKAVEDYYFPALIEKKIRVKFLSKDGSETLPNPISRSDLDQFVKLFKLAKNGKDEKQERLLVERLRKLKNTSLGIFAFEAAEQDESNSKRNNTVALMRGTGMVINYLRLGSDRYESAVGVFIGDEQAWESLKYSENAAHSQWNENSKRLERHCGEIGVNVVKAIKSRVPDRFASFQKSLQPDVSKSRSENGLLSRLLSKALSGSPGEKPVPDGNPNPASISLTKVSRDEKFSKWKLVIKSNENTPEEKFTLKIKPSISLAGDSKLISIKHMPFSVKDKNGKILMSNRDDVLEFPFESASVLEFYISYDNPGKKNFIVQCKCEAELEG